MGLDAYRQALEDLRWEAPAAYPVKVRRVAPSTLCDGREEARGDCEFRRRPEHHFRIRLDRTLSGDELLDVLAHEWAHALAWTMSHQTVRDHGVEWGLAFSRTYCIVFGVE